MSKQPASSYQQTAYQQAAAQGASPIGQVVLLYDTILRDIGRALAALDVGDVETRVNQLNHALTVIAYLQSVLDHERGGEAAKQFEKFYVVTRRLIMEANFKATREGLESLISLFGGVRQAWGQIEKQAPAGPSQASVFSRARDAERTHTVAIKSEEIDAPQLHWSV